MASDRLKIVEWFSGMKWTQKLVMLGREVGAFLENHPANSICNMIYYILGFVLLSAYMVYMNHHLGRNMFRHF